VYEVCVVVECQTKSDTTGTSEGCDNICIYIYILTFVLKLKKVTLQTIVRVKTVYL
jgi:hypothetical protein